MNIGDTVVLKEWKGIDVEVVQNRLASVTKVFKNGSFQVDTGEKFSRKPFSIKDGEVWHYEVGAWSEKGTGRDLRCFVWAGETAEELALAIGSRMALVDGKYLRVGTDGTILE